MKAEHEELSDFLQNAPIGVFRSTPHGRYLFANAAHAEILGYDSPEELMATIESTGRQTYVDEKDRRQIVEALEKRGELRNHEVRRKRKNGDVIWVSMSIRAVRNGDGSTLRYEGFTEDITERRRTEHDLERIFNLSRDMICVADINDSTFLRVNPAFARELGYSEADMVGKPFSDFIHPGDVEPTARVVAEKLRIGHAVLDFMNRYRHKNGGYRWLHWVSNPVPEEGLAYAVARDVTESRRTEEALRESEARYHKLFESMIEGVAIHELLFDKDGLPVDYRIVDVNPRFEEILGIPAAKVIGVKASALYGAGEPPYLDAYAAVAAGGPSVAFESYYPPMDKHFRISVFSPREHWFATVFQDVSVARRADERLKASMRELENTKALLDAVVEQAPIPMAVVSAPDEVARIVNPACDEILGVAGKSMRIGRTLGELMGGWRMRDAGGEPLRQEDYPLAKALRGERTYGLEAKLEGQDGSERWVSVYAAPIYNKEGELIAGYVAFPDITQRKKAETLVIQTEKMASVGGLAAGMAHEINNPLGIIQAAAQNCMRRVSPGFSKNLPAARKVGADLNLVHDYLCERGVVNFLRSIHTASERASRIVRNMLDFSRQSESHMSAHSVNALLDMALALARSDYNLKKDYDFRKIKIDREYDPDVPEVPLTETEMEQVFLNILKNAAQAMAEKAYPVKKGPRISLRTAVEPDWVRVEIADNGPGMSEDRRKRIFEPFYTSKEPGRGTGLGLSVSYFIITRNHGGQIEVESTPGAGTRFILRLPLSPPLASPERAHP